MIKRFLALSVAMHALAGTFLPDASRAPLPLEVPALDLAFTTASAPAGARAEPEGAKPPVQAPRPAPDRIRASAIAEPGPAVDEEISPTVTDHAEAVQDDEAESRRANHLLSLLRTALDEYFVYPPLARKHGWQGTVYVGLRLNTNGDLGALRLVRSSGYPILDRDALATLERIGSLPQARAWLDGRPLETELTVIYRLVGG